MSENASLGQSHCHRTTKDSSKRLQELGTATGVCSACVPSFNTADDKLDFTFLLKSLSVKKRSFHDRQKRVGVG